MASPQLYYGYASYLGFEAGHPSKCRSHYPKCPFSSKKMLQIYTGNGKAFDTTSRKDEENDGIRGGGGDRLDIAYQDTLQDINKQLRDSFQGRFLEVGARRKRYNENLTNYERKRRQARKERVKYLIKRRQNIMQKRNGNNTNGLLDDLENIKSQSSRIAYLNTMEDVSKDTLNDIENEL